jgi:riboflavin synthase
MWITSEDHSLMPYIAQKGSIAIDGISLTSNDVDGKKNRFSVSLIPFTLENTTLGLKRQGDLVNIEIDVLCRYVINYQNIGNN